MLQTISMLIALIILLALLIVISIVVGRNIKTFKTFASVTLPLFPLICTIIASPIGGGSIIGGIESGFHNGIAPLIGLLGFPFQLILIAFFIAPKKLDMLTVGDLFEKNYGKDLKIAIGIVVIMFNLGIIITLVYSLDFILKLFVASYTSWIIICSFIFILCCYFGGIVSVVWINIVQCLLMLIVPLLCFLLIFCYYDNLSVFIAHIPATHWQITSHYSYMKLFSMFIGFALGNMLMPSILQTINMAQSKHHAKISYLVASVFIALFAFFLVMCGISLAVLDVGNVDSIFKYALLKTPFSLRIVIALSVLIAIISSVKTYLNITAVTFVHDILIPLKIKGDALQAARTGVLIFGTICLMIALSVSASLLDMLLFTYTFWGPFFTTPLIGIYFHKTITTRQLYIISFLTFVAMALWQISGLNKATDIHNLVIGLAVNFVLYIIARIIKTRSTKKFKDF